MPEIAKFSTKLIEKRQLTSDVLDLRFEKPVDFDYQAGQFVQWLVPDHDKTAKRSYSMCSQPNDNYLQFCIKILPDGVASQYANKLKEGDILEFQGPRGRFICDTEDKPLHFVATGVGIAPMLGMIRDEFGNKKTKQEIELIFGVRHDDDIFWQSELEAIRAEHPNFSYQITLSKPSESWSGLKGRVTDHTGQNPETKQHFICGSPEMVKEVRQILLDKKVDPSRIHFEIF